jgi:hypothetical protein
VWRPSNKVGRLDGDGSVFLRVDFDSTVFNLTRGVVLESAKVRRVSVSKVKSMSFIRRLVNSESRNQAGEAPVSLPDGLNEEFIGV